MREPPDGDPPAQGLAVPFAPASAAPPAPAEVDNAAAETPPPFAAELALVKEVASFAGAVAETARAEFHLSIAAMVRAATLGAAAAIAVVAAWLCGTIALLFALNAWLGSPALAFAVVALAHALVAAIALRRRAIWTERVGFARTRSALASALADSEKKPP